MSDDGPAKRRRVTVEDQFLAGPDSKYRDRFRAVCEECFQARTPCSHFTEQRLRVLFVGHNPSDHAWGTGFAYSNPGNRCWPVLLDAGLVAGTTVGAQNHMPSTEGIGFVDIGTEKGSNAAAFTRSALLGWRRDFFKRCTAHLKRCAAAAETPAPLHAPHVVAFIGKAQFKALFEPALKTVPAGQVSRRPAGWPFRTSAVWVLDSPSGRNVITRAKLVGQYKDLAAYLDAKVPAWKPPEEAAVGAGAGAAPEA